MIILAPSLSHLNQSSTQRWRMKSKFNNNAVYYIFPSYIQKTAMEYTSEDIIDQCKPEYSAFAQCVHDSRAKGADEDLVCGMLKQDLSGMMHHYSTSIYIA
jgi:hypothetical protein